MAVISTVALTDTFDTWRQRTNQVTSRLNQFAINESAFYANTITANVAFTSAGLMSATGRATIGTNLTVSGNTTLGAAGKKVTSTGLIAHTGRATISTNIAVSGNTELGGSNTFIDLNGNRLTDYAEHANTAITTGATVQILGTQNVVRFTLGNNLACTLPSGQPTCAPAVKTLIIYVKQDGTGSRTFTLAAPSGESISYNNSASQPAVVATAGKVSIYTCLKFDADPVWYVSLSFIDD